MRKKRIKWGLLAESTAYEGAAMDGLNMTDTELKESKAALPQSWCWVIIEEGLSIFFCRDIVNKKLSMVFNQMVARELSSLWFSKGSGVAGTISSLVFLPWALYPQQPNKA